MKRAAAALTAVFAAVFAAGGCGAAAPPPIIDTLDGEVTVHGFPAWTHAWAVFLEPGVPVADVHLDTLLAYPVSPTEMVGACAVTPVPSCPSGCPPGSFCQADDRCAPAPAWTFLDEGAVTVSGGGGGVPVEQLAFDPATGLYASTPAAGPARFISDGGGERVTVAFASGLASTSSALRAPTAVELTSLPSPLTFAPGGFHLGWAPGDAELVELLLTASTAARTVTLRCLSDDGGGFDVPAAALAALPPPPRDVHLEVTRNTEELLPTRGSHGVRVHVGYTVTADGAE